MKQTLFIFYFCFCSITIFAQTELTIGKRKGSILNREILESNIAQEGGYLKPIFFKSRKKDQWEAAGYLSNRLKPYLYTSKETKAEFKTYRKKALSSHLLILPATAGLVAFNFVAINNIANNKSKTFIGAYLKPNALACLAVYFGSFYGSYYLNKNAENHLFNAVQIKNGRLKGSLSENGVGIKYIIH